MLVAVVSLYVIGVGLPLAGLVLLGVKARRAVSSAKTRTPDDNRTAIAIRGPGEDGIRISFADLTTAARNVVMAPFDSWGAVVRDFIFIGVGVVASGTASIMSLFL